MPIVVTLALLAAAAVVVAVSPLDLTHDKATHRPYPGAAVGAGASSRASTPRATMVPAGRPGRLPPTRPTSLPGEGTRGDGAGVFDDGSPAVANLDPGLLSALRMAATAARDDGVEFQVNSGWRSAAYQRQLLREAIARYGSKHEAERWVATPETSAHVSGDAVDLGPSSAASWLSRHGAAYGLCQIYRNEPWHYELRQGAALNGCPAMYADPTQDPRMHR
ncbi:M15 family metallopeptidase [Pedococcus bigeumensis]|uniref:M15 family metallopeptidase n=1 Tax=Pedococcus bigeumensis TaxID=433644 RepID=UPI001F4FA887|nr:M15 family metallopeptidase [Pedococcus bigeumensis]